MQEKNVFIKLDEYKDILDIIALINEKVREARVILGKINDLKNQEDTELDAWKNSLDDVERKLKYIGFIWDDDAQKLVIETYDKFSPYKGTKLEVQRTTGSITLNKTYIFSTMRFMVRIAQRMWGRKIPRKKRPK